MKTAITGGIGSGKSYVCSILQQQGIQIYDCDAAAKRLMRTSPVLQGQLKALIGPDVYDEEGRLDKAVVARFLLASESNAHAIDAIVHPAVADDFLKSGLQWMECAILYESGFDCLVDRVVMVSAPEDVRIERVMKRDGISREKALEWIGRQWPQDEVRRRADYEIINDGNADIVSQLERILHIKKHNPMQQTILAIAGKPGLYKLVSRAKNSLIVEALDATHRRMPAFSNDRITSLADIAMFTDADDVPLMDVLESLKTVAGGKTTALDPKKASGDELRELFAKVLPSYDRDRVHTSDIKKLLQWYNILVENGITDFKEEMKPTEGDNIDDRKEKLAEKEAVKEEPVEKKPVNKKAAEKKTEPKSEAPAKKSAKGSKTKKADD